MKTVINLFFLMFILFIYENKSFALTDYQIREICKKQRRKLTCIKNMQNKRFELLKGNRIKIPVIPFKR